jgi:hypothetical protein
MLNDPTNMHNGDFIASDKQKHVRILVYNWDTHLYNAEDVNASVMRLGLNIVDELSPRTGGKNPLLDVRVSHMDAFLWDLRNIRSGFIVDFALSIRVAVGVDDDSAKLHSWAQLTAEGRKILTSEDIPDELQSLIYKYCGVEIVLST